jgi:hypothetical protein
LLYLFRLFLGECVFGVWDGDGVYIGLIQFTGGLGIETWDGGWIGVSIIQSYGFEEL